MLEEGDRSSKPNFWVSLELQRAVSELEKAKGYDLVIAAIQKCKHICGGFSIHVARDLLLT